MLGTESGNDEKEGGIILKGSILSRRARSPDPARAKRVLGESRRRASLDSCARRNPKDAGNPAQILRSATMSHETIQVLLIRNEREETRPATADEILRAARDVMSRRVRRGTSMSSPQIVRDFLSIKLGMLEHETFCVMFLDSRHKLIEFVELFRGTVDGASVYPREVVKLALAKNAAAVVCAHPHPSGVAEPSHADEMITRRLREALGLVDIRLLDHLIVAGGVVVSMAEKGIL
jgi:DNA repair protein RadC